MSILLINTNSLDLPMADKSVHCVVTSPPYWALRDYGVSGQLGLESTPDCLGWATGNECGECYVCRMVQAFREVKRVLRDDGTLFLNLGDSYTNMGKNGGQSYGKNYSSAEGGYQTSRNMKKNFAGLKPKDLVGIPWRVALALQADGWYLRSDIIWAKPNPMPESVTDRPTKAHEYLFLLTKNERYFYDAAAVKEPSTGCSESAANFKRETKEAAVPGKRLLQHRIDRQPTEDNGTRNRRTVWTIATEPTSEAHFATYPRKLVEPCIKAGCPAGGIVFDPFNGSGTTGIVARALGRHYIGADLSLTYLSQIARKRLSLEALDAWTEGKKSDGHDYLDSPLFFGMQGATP